MPWGKKYGGRNFVKGNCANPKGRERVPEEVRKAKEMNKAEFLEILNRYIHSTRHELYERAKNPETPAMELIIIKVISEAIKSGSLAYWAAITDRLIGKVEDRHRFVGSLHAAMVKAIHDVEMANQQAIDGEVESE